MTTGLSDFFHYNLWANLRLLDACEQLSDIQLDATPVEILRSVREILQHMLASEEGYVKHFTGRTPLPPLKEVTTFPGFAELRQRAEQSGQTLIAIAEQDNNLGRILHLEGGTYDVPARVVLIQAINHGVDHRSHIATLLDAQGIGSPGLDGWSYNDATYAISRG
jgi:uncharacterized damage-inducible protein DinB